MTIGLQYNELDTGMVFLKELVPRVATYNGQVSIDLSDQTYSLKEAVQLNKVTAEQIRAQAEFDFEEGICTKILFKDGGSSIYRYPNYTILSSIPMGRDCGILIGSPNMMINSDEIDEFLSEDHLGFDVKLLRRLNGNTGLEVINESLPYVATYGYDVTVAYSFDVLPLDRVMKLGYITVDGLLRQAQMKVEQGLGEIVQESDDQSIIYYLDEYSIYEHIENDKRLGIIIGVKNMQIRWD